MSDEVALSSAFDDQAPGGLGESKAVSQSVGQQLRSAREAKGMAVAEVAKALKLSPRQVEALEADDWPSLPCKTIIRGFVRNDARLLNLNPDLLMSSLDGIEMPHASELEIISGTPVKLSSENNVDRRDYVRVFSGLLILVLAVVVTYFFPKEMWESTVAAFKAATQPNETVAEQVVVETPAPVAEPVAVDSLAPEPAALPEAQPDSSLSLPAPLDVPAQPVVTESNVLKFSFDQAAWVEVRDRNGEILLSQVNQAGSQRDVEGHPPFVLVIGNAGHVSLQYKGKPVDLSKRSKEDVARLSLE